MIKIGNTEITDVSLGSTPINQVYVGNNLIWTRSAPVLPYDAQVEYLQSSGTQYINTGKVPDASTGIYVELTRTKTGDSYCCGLRDTSGNTRWLIGTNNTYTYKGWGGYGNNITIAHGIAKLNYLNSGKWEAKQIDAANFTSYNLGELPFTPQNEIRLFGSAGVSASYTKWSGRIHAVKISQGSDIIFDFIPVRKDGVGYMYDRISGNLYGNNGTGSFTLGPDVT